MTFLDPSDTATDDVTASDDDAPRGLEELDSGLDLDAGGAVGTDDLTDLADLDEQGDHDDLGAIADGVGGDDDGDEGTHEEGAEEEPPVVVLSLDATGGTAPVDADAGADDGEGGEPGEIALTGDEELLAVVALDAERALSPFDRPGDWYVVHTYSGYENKVKNNLASRVRSMGVEERIHEVVIPMEDVIEYKGGRKTVVQKKVFPGYLLVRMDLDDNSWYVVRNTPGVTGFVGSGAKPTPLSRREVEDILGVEQPEGEAPVEKKARPRLDFEVGDQVRVTQGPFADFDGAIADIDEDRAKLKVLVNIFGRETPVELEFGQVAKL